MENKNILEMIGITKTFPGVKALDNVSFSCKYGEIHALLGENGAGKSTLIKVLSAAYQLDSGEILFKNKSFKDKDPISAQKAGIGVIYQEFNLVPHLSVAENVFLGREPLTPYGLIDKSYMEIEALKAVKSLGLDLDIKKKASLLSVAEQQMVEIAKVLSLNAELIVMDEPTATLTDHEIKFLFKTILKLKDAGKTIIYISHRLEEIFEICDRVTILKDGEFIGSEDVDKMTKDNLIKMMVGRTLSDYFPEKVTNRSNRVLEVKNLSIKGVLDDISFTANGGEILGFSGLVGAGRTELARAIFGADRIDEGEIFIDDEIVYIKNPGDAIEHKIGFATEDRKQQGLILSMSIQKNITLPILKSLEKWGFLLLGKEIALVNSFISKLTIASRDQHVKVKTLSGGNQQKVVLAKWLAKDCKVLILDEPTRGIDVGAKSEIYNLMRKLTAQGKAIIMISSELLEVIGVSDRILVMNQGRVVCEVPPDKFTEEEIMKYAIGGV